MGTTKLTRKEIRGEDPIHDAIVKVIELTRDQGKYLAGGAVILVLLAFGIYFGLRYLSSRDVEVQSHLARGMAFYRAQVDASALDDPYGKGPDPVFRSVTARNEAARKEFEWVLQNRSSSKQSVIARYYLALSQLRDGQKAEAAQNLLQVKANTQELTLGYLAGKVLAKLYLEEGKNKESEEIIAGMIKDPQCNLPKEELKLILARAQLAQGNRDAAIKTLREAREESGTSSLQSMLSQELTRLEGGSPFPPADTQIIPVPR